jgi:hypothetical protein
MITWEEWEATYQPTPNPDSPEQEVFWQAFYDDLGDIPEGTPRNRIWTMIDGSGRYTELVSGVYIINRLGYFITDVPWTEDVYVTNDKEQYA